MRSRELGNVREVQKKTKKLFLRDMYGSPSGQLQQSAALNPTKTAASAVTHPGEPVRNRTHIIMSIMTAKPTLHIRQRLSVTANAQNRMPKSI
jgi:hypothetical protein